MLRFIRGWVRISVTGRAPERFLNLCRNRGLVMWNILTEECGYSCFMYREDYRNCGDLAEKAGVILTCMGEYGLPACRKRYGSRQAFFAACFLLLAAIWFSSIFLWDIRIENNLYYTDDQILDCLKEQGIQKWSRKSRVDSEAIEQQLRDHFERISWSAVSVEGTILKINLAENYGTLAAVMADSQPADLVAEMDGVVESIIVRKGIAQVKPGDPVTKGQVLVSGSVPRHNDSLEVFGYEFVHADAEVQVQGTIDYEDHLNPDQIEKEYTNGRGSVYHFRFADRTFSIPTPARVFWNLTDQVTGGWFQTDWLEGTWLDEIRQKAGIGGNPAEKGGTSRIGTGFRTFSVPEAGISLYGYREEWKEYQIRHRWLGEKEASDILQQKISRFLENMQKNEDVVVENQVRIYYDSGVYHASGKIVFLRPQAGYQSIDYGAYEAEVVKPEQESSGEE